MSGLNESRRPWVIIENVAELANGNFQDGFTYKCLWPHRLEKLLFSDELASTTEKVVEHCECFRSELKRL